MLLLCKLGIFFVDPSYYAYFDHKQLANLVLRVSKLKKNQYVILYSYVKWYYIWYQIVFYPGIIPIPKSRDFWEKCNPEIPGLLWINPGIFGIGFFLNLTLLCFVWKLIYCSCVQTCSNSLSDCNNKTLSNNFIWQKWRFMRTWVRNVLFTT